MYRLAPVFANLAVLHEVHELRGERLRNAEGAALVSATMPTSADGITTKLVAAPRAKAPEWLYSVRPADVTETLNP